MVKVCVKWNKEKYDIDVDTTQPVVVFKYQLFSLTQVPVDRQKIMGLKGGVLKDESNWSDLGLTEGKQLMLMGSAEEVSSAPVGVKFIEDLPQKQQVISVLPAGLTNLGNTCYMNATLQCLKAVPELNKAVRTYEPPKTSSTDTMLAKTAKSVFQELESSKEPVTPLMFLNAFRHSYPQFQEKSSGGVYAQQDAEESWSLFLTSLAREFYRSEQSKSGDTQMSTGNQFGISNEQLKESVIGKLFGIEMVETFQCKDNPKEESTQRIEHVLKLNCNITIETSFLFEGLKRGMEEEITKRSETLGREAVYTKKSLISVLPPYLTIQFVRFYWKEQQKTKAKIIRIVQFPFVLDMFPLCSPELKEKLVPNRKLLEDYENAELERKRMDKDSDKDKKDKNTTSTKPKLDTTPLVLGDIKPNETGKYELIAVLTHQGLYADSGHYVGWVKQAEDKWLKYDDRDVTECNNEEIKKLFGGGQWHVAYMCIYKSIPVPTQSSKITEETSNTTTTTTTTTSMDTSN